MEPLPITRSFGYRQNNIARLQALYGAKPPNAPIQVPPIDFSKDNIVIWVPGTGMGHIPSEVKLEILRRLGQNVSMVNAEYLANWKFLTSMPHGQQTLIAILEHIQRHKRPKTKVYLVGLSQGAMIISDTLAIDKYYDLVTRAVLFGHPSISGSHQEDLGTLKVREFNNFLDPATLEWRGDNLKIIKSLDGVFRGDVLQAVHLLGVAAKNPSETLLLITAGLRYLPFYNSPDDAFGPHNYTHKYKTGISWLLTEQ